MPKVMCDKINTPEGCKLGDNCGDAHHEWQLWEDSNPYLRQSLVFGRKSDSGLNEFSGVIEFSASSAPLVDKNLDFICQLSGATVDFTEERDEITKKRDDDTVGIRINGTVHQLQLARDSIFKVLWDIPLTGNPWLGPSLQSSEEAQSSSKKTKVTSRKKSNYKVNWLSWGKEAFKKANEEKLPIYLWIGYSTSTWCHVVDKATFEDESIVKLLNDSFVCIKVDRDERPDITRVCLTKVDHFDGWPFTFFLHYDGSPFAEAFSYPPPTCESALRQIIRIWGDREDRLLFIHGGINDFKRHADALPMSASLTRLPDDLLMNALFQCRKTFASRYNPHPLRSVPEFPRPVEIHLMLYYGKKLAEAGKQQEANAVLTDVSLNLKCMAASSIHDHIGGGFHTIGSRFRRIICDDVGKYRMEECRLVPDFEKLLYDQGQLASVYLDAFSLTKDPLYSRISRDILDYLIRGMIGAKGQIFSAVDADSGESEGFTREKEVAFYQWTTNEVEEALKGDATLFMNHYNLHKESVGVHVLFERKDTDADENSLRILGDCRKKLFEARKSLPMRRLDEKVIVSWNGLAISSFARASKILKGEAENTNFYFPVVDRDPEVYIEVAKNAAAFIMEHLYNPQTRKLKYSLLKSGLSEERPGFLNDYVFLIFGLLDLYEYGGETKWLCWATELQDSQDELFLDREGGGYFNTTSGDPYVVLRVKEGDDGDEPSGNSVSAINLARLALMMSGSKSDEYRKNAEHLLAVFEKRLRSQPTEVPLLCCAADRFICPSQELVVLVGPRSCELFQNMLTTAHASYTPYRRVIHIDPTYKEDMDFWEKENKDIALQAKHYFDIAPNGVFASVRRGFTWAHHVTQETLASMF